MFFRLGGAIPLDADSMVEWGIDQAKDLIKKFTPDYKYDPRQDWWSRLMAKENTGIKGVIAGISGGLNMIEHPTDAIESIYWRLFRPNDLKKRNEELWLKDVWALKKQVRSKLEEQDYELSDMDIFKKPEFHNVLSKHEDYQRLKDMKKYFIGLNDKTVQRSFQKEKEFNRKRQIVRGSEQHKNLIDILMKNFKPGDYGL